MLCFDSHAHLDDRRFDEDRGEIFDTLHANGVGWVMNVGCDLASSQRSIALAEQYPFVWASVGSHPDDADQVNGKLLDQYRRLAGHEKVMAIGEIGLDYHYEDVPRARQIIAFEEQIELAEALKLPVIVHMREAWQDAMDIVRRHPDLRGVFHCFSGSRECALWLAERGWYVGFTGVVTFKNARKAVECVEALPLEQIRSLTVAAAMTAVTCLWWPKRSPKSRVWKAKRWRRPPHKTPCASTELHKAKRCRNNIRSFLCLRNKRERISYFHEVEIYHS